MSEVLPTRALNSNIPGTSTSGTRRILTFVITEELAGGWQYHWSSIQDQEKALCGRQTMPANIAPENWGGSHGVLELHWCPECQQLKEKILPDL